jgi:methionyl-tRNA formyltransferase
VILVITQPDKPIGRKQELKPGEVKIFAQNNHLKLLQPNKLRDEAFINEIKKMNPDLMIVAAYGKILPPQILAIPRLGSLNIHASLLPKYRGASPIAFSILNGDKETGFTIMLMDEKMDTGPTVHQEKIAIPEKIYASELSEKLSELGARVLVEMLPKYLSGEIKPIKQDETQATYTKILNKEDGRIDWNKKADYIERMTRAFYPWPTAWTTWQGKNLKILKANLKPYNDSKNPGEVLKTNDGSLGVKCGQGILIIEELQLEGKKTLKINDFLRGQKDFVGSRLI